MIKNPLSKNWTISKNKLKIMSLSLFLTVALAAKIPAQGSIGSKTAKINGGPNIPFFKNNVNKTSYDVTFKPNSATTANVNNPIKDGGVFLFKKGNYTLGEIKLKSNTRIEIEAGVTFKIDKSGGNSTLFNLGRNTRNNNNNNDVIKNVEIRGLGAQKTNGLKLT